MSASYVEMSRDYMLVDFLEAEAFCKYACKKLSLFYILDESICKSYIYIIVARVANCTLFWGTVSHLNGLYSKKICTPGVPFLYPIWIMFSLHKFKPEVSTGQYFSILPCPVLEKKMQI